jgi:hypothetical protein
MNTRDSVPMDKKRQEREADYSRLSSAEVKNRGALSPLPHVFVA